MGASPYAIENSSYTVAEYPISNTECPMMKCSLSCLCHKAATNFMKKFNLKESTLFSFYIGY